MKEVEASTPARTPLLSWPLPEALCARAGCWAALVAAVQLPCTKIPKKIRYGEVSDTD